MRRNANGAGSIRKKKIRRNGREYECWEGRVTVGFDPNTGNQIQKSVSGKTQKEVAQKLQEIAVEVSHGTYTMPSKMTVKDWLTIWTKEYMEDVKESTAFLYTRYVDKYIVPKLGSIKLEALTTPAIQAFYNGLIHPKGGEKPLSAKTVKNIHGALHKALQQAVLVSYLRTNPVDACKPPRVVLGLTWDCVDFERGTLLIKQQLRREQKKGGKYYFSSPKNGKSRTLTLAPSVLQLFRLQKLHQNGLRAKAGELWQDNNMVFSNQVGGYLSYRTVYDCFKRIVSRIGTPNTRFHDLRHTYATMAIRAGDNIKTVQENLGHATAAFTLDIYGHVTAGMRQDSARRMEGVIQAFSR